MKPYAPGPRMRGFMDWTVNKTTVWEPHRCPRKYDYWYGGWVTGMACAFLLDMLF